MTGAVLVVAATVVERPQIPAAVDDPHERVVEVLGEPDVLTSGSGPIGPDGKTALMRWGVWFEPVRPVAELVELARLAEAEGATACFVADEGTDRDVWVALTAIVLGTEQPRGRRRRSRTRSPAIRSTSAAAAAIAGRAGAGRVWHGLGVGGSRVLAPLGLRRPKPFTALREAVD